MTCAERYAKLKAEHRCVKCKQDLPADYTMALCERCREYGRHYNRPPRQIKPRPKCSGVLTISQVIELAKEKGISYGEMVVLIEKEGSK